MKCQLHKKYDIDCAECQKWANKSAVKELSKRLKRAKTDQRLAVNKVRKVLRQALDIISREQYWGDICLGCKKSKGHTPGCPVEAVFKKARDHGLHYE